MADATVHARVEPLNVDQDIDVLAAALAARAEIPGATVVVDPGQDLHVSVDITRTEAGDTTGSLGAADINAAVAAVGNCVVVGDIEIEADPTLSTPADVALDISDGNVVKRTYDVTLVGPDASIASVALTVNEIPSGAAVISRGNPQGHQSQLAADNTIDVTFGPAVAGDEVGSPHNVTIEVTDSNGRTATDTIVVTVTA